MQVERKLGGRLLDVPRQVLFQYSGDNLCLAIEELEGGWRCKQAANYQVTISSQVILPFLIYFLFVYLFFILFYFDLFIYIIIIIFFINFNL